MHNKAMALIPPQFIDAVVAIGFNVDGEKEPKWAATGFLYGKRASEDEPIYTVALVTNRHVFHGEKRACLRFNPKSSEPATALWIDLVDQEGVPLWASDSAVDLAVVAIRVDELVQRGIGIGVFTSDRDVLRLSDAADLGVVEGDGVFALGFPLGLVGAQRNYVIVRQGAIARIRDAYAGVSSEILVDISIFPGNSGGPIVTRPEVVALAGTKAVGRAALLGVVSSYLTYQDTAVSQQTGQIRVIFQENSGLASVIPVDHVIRLFDLNLADWERRGVATAMPQPRATETSSSTA